MIEGKAKPVEVELARPIKDPAGELIESVEITASIVQGALAHAFRVALLVRVYSGINWYTQKLARRFGIQKRIVVCHWDRTSGQRVYPNLAVLIDFLDKPVMRRQDTHRHLKALFQFALELCRPEVTFTPFDWKRKRLAQPIGYAIDHGLCKENGPSRIELAWRHVFQVQIFADRESVRRAICESHAIEVGRDTAPLGPWLNLLSTIRRGFETSARQFRENAHGLEITPLEFDGDEVADPQPKSFSVVERHTPRSVAGRSE